MLAEFVVASQSERKSENLHFFAVWRIPITPLTAPVKFEAEKRQCQSATVLPIIAWIMDLLTAVFLRKYHKSRKEVKYDWQKYKECSILDLRLNSPRRILLLGNKLMIFLCWYCEEGTEGSTYENEGAG